VRLVQVTIPAGKRQAVLDTLDTEGLDYVVAEESSGREYAAVVSVPLPKGAVEPVLDELRDVGLGSDAYTVVLSAETVISDRFEELESRFSTNGTNGDRVAREEIKSTASGLAPSLRTYVLMTVISAVIATAGMLLDSPATVVGSMVIAPLIGPAMETSVGTVLDDREMFREGVKYQLLGVALAVGSAGLFALFVKSTYLVSPGLQITEIQSIRQRLAPDFLSLAVALGSGVAGVISLSAGVSTALVGVMIAAALIPPAAAVGIGIAWGLPLVSIGSAVLVLVNVLSINLAALITLWYRGYRPERLFQVGQARSITLKRIGVLLVSIAILSVFLGGVTYTSFQSAAFEESARGEVQTVLDRPAYEETTMLEVTAEYDDAVLLVSPDRVIVTVGHPAGATYPNLADRLATQIREETGRDVTVEVHFVQFEQSGEPSSTHSTSGLAGVS